MPELPEVETVRRGLEPWLVNRKIKRIEVLHQGAHRGYRKMEEIPLSAAHGSRIKAIRRRGKFLWFELNEDIALVGHLGMSGQIRIQSRRLPSEPHLRLRMDFGDRRHEFRFIDQRTFGWMAIDPLALQGSDLLPLSVLDIAPDIFDSNFNHKHVIARIMSSKSEIKRVLLDQSILSGIGNIYADEALWRAKIHPERKAATLEPKEISAILSGVKQVMTQALSRGGTSFDELYVNVNGESGYFDLSLRAYGQEGEPCHRCGTLIKRIEFGNRSSHFCPRCQPRGRNMRAITNRSVRTR